MAKVVLLVDAFMKSRGIHGRPLIYGTLLNTGLYFLAALVLHYLEQTIRLIRHHHVRFAEASHEALLAMERAQLLGDHAFGTCLDLRLLHDSRVDPLYRIGSFYGGVLRAASRNRTYRSRRHSPGLVNAHIFPAVRLGRQRSMKKTVFENGPSCGFPCAKLGLANASKQRSASSRSFFMVSVFLLMRMHATFAPLP